MGDSTTARSIADGKLVPEHDGPDRHSVMVGGGRAELFCSISPDKHSDNQDSLLVLELDEDRCVLAVADGAGGIQGGRRASRLALVTLREEILAARQHDQELRATILHAMEVANQHVVMETRGAASTLTVVSIEGREARVFHVGDSVAMITGQRSAVKLQTVAHSPVGFALAAGFLTEADAMFHPERHVVSNFVGTQEMIIEVGSPIRLARHDSILLASDGLTDNLFSDEIMSVMRRGAIDAAVDTLVEKTHHRMQRRDMQIPGKADDLAIILFRKPD